MIRAKKSLGQNFLSHTPTLKAMASEILLGEKATVIEVGPGKGALTKHLLEAGHTVYAIEKDNRLIGLLEETFTEEIKNKKFHIIHGDALEINYAQLGVQNSEFHIVANLPYYITGIFIRQTLENPIRPKSMTLLLQKEVVDRILAVDSKESLLALSVKAYGEVKRICNVSKRYFTPSPKVDSAVIHISNIGVEKFKESGITEAEFFVLLKTSFASKRKTLLNNFKGANFYTDEVSIEIGPLLNFLGYNEKIRAEKIEIAHWFKIAEMIYNR